MSARCSGRDPLGGGAWRTALAALAVLALMGCGSSCGGATAQGSAGTAPAAPAETPATEEGIPVRVEQVRREALSALYSTSATLRADQQATVTSRARGVVRQLLAEEGQWVEAGQPLAVLDDDEQRIERDRAVTVSDTRQREYRRAARLHEQGMMSDEDYEVVRREADEARQLAELAELRLRRTLIRAPFSGRILLRHVDLGATVADGTAVFDIADLTPLYADVTVPEREVVRLAAGQPVRITLDANDSGRQGRIERIAPRVDPASGTVKVTVAVQASRGLRPGSFVRVDMVTDTHEQALVVPRAALVAEGRRWHVFRLHSAEGTVQRLEVTRGFEERDRVEVLETVGGQPALAPGDPVVVVGASALTDGAQVRVFADDGTAAEGSPGVGP